MLLFRPRLDWPARRVFARTGLEGLIDSGAPVIRLFGRMPISWPVWYITLQFPAERGADAFRTGCTVDENRLFRICVAVVRRGPYYSAGTVLLRLQYFR